MRTLFLLLAWLAAALPAWATWHGCEHAPIPGVEGELVVQQIEVGR